MAEPGADTGGSPFWRFSLQFYRMAGVADACIALQDQVGVDVNLMLFLLWNASLRRQLSRKQVEDLETRVAEWRNGVVIPLREMRRQLKSPPTLIEKAAAEAFRTRIKQVELEAERLQQESLFALAQASPLGQSAPSPAEAARENVAAYQAVIAKAFPPAATETLLAAFSELAAPPK